jgi:hypothetical protein
VTILQRREQLQALGGLRGELSVLQAALTHQKRQQQQHKVQEACAEADRQQEVRAAAAMMLGLPCSSAQQPSVA